MNVSRDRGHPKKKGLTLQDRCRDALVALQGIVGEEFELALGRGPRFRHDVDVAAIRQHGYAVRVYDAGRLKALSFRRREADLSLLLNGDKTQPPRGEQMLRRHEGGR